ncbi:hypothetical protein M9435_003365 [Picochlorum sp. BPE23]|nr:hypothetical protein M9435_003365 [Picochlorum sp. BPE23]
MSIVVGHGVSRGPLEHKGGLACALHSVECSSARPVHDRHRQHSNTKKQKACSTSDGMMEGGTCIQDGFDPHLVTALRTHYNDRFSNPLETTSERFIWDYWHVPGQYSLMRTPADAFFPPDLYMELESKILDFGQERLGCRGISPIWLSYYVSGHFQEFHTDAPHGPFAFVLSLSDYHKETPHPFTGGETKILRDDILDYWRCHDSSTGIELPDIVESIPPYFGRMTVFDPRKPHGVTMVDGVKNPLDARIVLHGWYTEPSAYFEGHIDETTATDVLNHTLEALYEELGQLSMACGTLILRLHITHQGTVESINVLANTLKCRHPQSLDAMVSILTSVSEHLETMSFSAAMTPEALSATITLPLIFES